MAIRHLKDRHCLITGAASGIGRALALAVASEGAILYLSDINGAALDAVCSDIRARGGLIGHARAFDISDIGQVRIYADEVHRAVDHLDVLMNVAGIAIWGSVEDLRHEDWRRCIDVNLMGPIHMIECFVPRMIAAGRGGHIVNVSSAAGLFPLPLHAAYSASKFGLRGISEVLRFDLERHGIGVSLVCPGAVRTGLVQTVQVAGVDMTHPEAVKLRTRFSRHAVTPEAAAEAILRGVKSGRYLVFTSFDIRFAYWWQRKFALPFELVMRFLNRYAQGVMTAAKRT